MKCKKPYVLIILAIFFVVVLFLCLGEQHTLKRSIAGRIVRFILGSAGAHQEVEDLADDIRGAKELSSLRFWANDVMERYRLGSLKTIGERSYWAKGTHKLDPNEIYPEIRKFWRAPEITIEIDASGECKYVAYCWYSKGVVIASPDCHSLDFEYFYAIEAKPGIFAYSIEK